MLMYQEVVDLHHGTGGDHAVIVDLGPTTDLSRQIDWCLENIGFGSWNWYYVPGASPDECAVRFGFLSREDAVTFNLTWG